MVDELAYSIHLGNDKNKTKRAKEIAETNASGTTSFANSSIQNKQQLSKVNKHNLRDYDKQKDLIYVIVGTESVYKDVQNMYQLEFQQAQEEYNLKQTRDDRKIKEPYFDYVAKSNRDLACELIIELGDMDFWQDKNMDYRLKMVDVYKQQIADLRRIQPNFHIANAVIHFDETSPHMHIVGIPIKEGYKNGMKKQVAKSQIFTKDTLKVLQDKMRACGIRSFNKVYDESRQLKKKKAGRNVDFRVGDEMSNYREFKKSKEANIERLKSTNSKAIKLDDSTDRVRNKLDNLPTSKLNKNKFILDGNDVEELKGYLKEVDDVSVSVKDVGDIQSTIDKYDEYLEKHEKEKLDLRDTIYERDLKIQSKENTIELLNEEICKKIMKSKV